MTAFSLPAGKLSTATDWAARATPSRGAAPILSGLLLEVAEDQVTISGYDGDRRATATVKALVTEPGRLLLPGRLLASVAAVADRGDLTVATDSSDSMVRVSAGRGRWTLNSLPVQDYPELLVPGEAVGTVDAAEFALALKRVLPAVHRDTGLPNLKGVKLESEGDELILVATDRYRLARAAVPWRPAGERALDELVPSGLMEVAARAEATGALNIHIGEAASGHLFGTSADSHLTVGAQIAEEYVPWRTIFPAETDWLATMSVDQLSRALKQVTPSLNETKLPQIRMAFADDAVTITTLGEGAAADVKIEAAIQGEPILVKFNADYLKGALEALGSEQVSMMFTSPTRPVRLTGDDPDQYQHLVMPVQRPD